MLKHKPRKNDHKFFLDTPFSMAEKSRISESLAEITALAIQGSGLIPLPKSFFYKYISSFGTRLIGVIFDPARGGSTTGPYIGSIAAFDVPASELFSFFHNFRPDDDFDEFEIINFLRRRQATNKFVLILERGREVSDYAKKEMAKLNAEFYSYLCENNYMIVTVCRESTSYKTYKKMAAEGSFRFFYDFRSTSGYFGSEEPFHLLVGEFLNNV